MAGRSAQPGGQPQYSLPKYAPEEQFVQKKQGEYIQNDVRQLSIHMDVETPFRDVKDAMTRLLPFHLFNAVDAAELDLDDTPDHAGANLMSNRHEAWEELCVAKANDLRRKAVKSATTIATIEQQMDSEVLSGARPLDRLAMVKLQQEDLRRKIAVEKAELQKLVVIAQPVAPQPAVVQQGPTAAVTAQGMAAKAPMAAAGVQQQAVQGSLTLQQMQQMQQIQQVQLLRQQMLQQLQQQQQLQGGLQPAQLQQYLLLQQQQQQQQAALQQQQQQHQATLQQQHLQLLQTARKQ